MNPGNTYGLKSFHTVALRSHLEVCNHMINVLENENPGNDSGRTPLHFAARNGYLQICKLICNVIKEKKIQNPMLVYHLLIWQKKNGYFEVLTYLKEINNIA